MLRLADLFDSSGQEMRARSKLGPEILRDEGVVESSELSKTSYDVAADDIRSATTGKHGLLTRSIELDADALVVRATVLTYRWIDELQEAAYRTLGSIAGRAIGYLAPNVALGGAILSAGLIETDALDRDGIADYVNELAETNPDLMDHVISGGGGLVEAHAAAFPAGLRSPRGRPWPDGSGGRSARDRGRAVRGRDDGGGARRGRPRPRPRGRDGRRVRGVTPLARGAAHARGADDDAVPHREGDGAPGRRRAVHRLPAGSRRRGPRRPPPAARGCRPLVVRRPGRRRDRGRGDRRRGRHGDAGRPRPWRRRRSRDRGGRETPPASPSTRSSPPAPPRRRCPRFPTAPACCRSRTAPTPWPCSAPSSRPAPPTGWSWCSTPAAAPAGEQPAYVLGGRAVDHASHPDLRAEISRIQGLGYLAG